MKRTRGILGFVMVACLLGGLAGCGGQAASASAAPARPASSSPASSAAADAASSEAAAASSVPAPEDGVLVAYFSATGNTRAVAEKIAALTGGDLYEIVPAQPYTSEDLDWRNSQSRSSQEMDDPDARPEIAGSPVEMDGYGTLYLGYPIWHGQAPRILSTFVESCDLEGMRVIPFCTSGSSGIGSSADSLAEQAGGGAWLEGRRFDSGVPDSELQAWIDGLA